MEEKCLLCGTKAYAVKHLDNLFIDCNSCGKYSVSTMAMKFYFDKPGFLVEADFAKLREYLKSNSEKMFYLLQN